VRFKVVPPARGLDALEAVRAALPLVPDDEESCCARVVARTDVPSRDEAKEWVTFCRALGLAEETDSGYRRIRGDPDRETLAGWFRDHVYGADDVLAVLEDAEEPLAAADAYRRFDVPEWERQRHTDPETVWHDRVTRLLDWAVAFGLVERAEKGYRR